MQSSLCKDEESGLQDSSGLQYVVYISGDSFENPVMPCIYIMCRSFLNETARCGFSCVHVHGAEHSEREKLLCTLFRLNSRDTYGSSMHCALEQYEQPHGVLAFVVGPPMAASLQRITVRTQSTPRSPDPAISKACEPPSTMSTPPSGS